MKNVGPILAIGAALAALYLLRLDNVAGLYVDDAYYVVLAQAIASGQGYTLISSAVGPILPAFPPGFALLLAPVVAVTSKFPGNTTSLKLVSIVAMLGVAALTYRYLRHHRGIDQLRAVTVAVITAMLPGFVFLATSTLMAECVFTLSLVASAVAIERAAVDDARSTRRLAIAAAISAASWLVRSAGVAAVLTGIVILFWRRGWRRSAAFVVVCGLVYMPWAIYQRGHQPTEAQREAHGGSIVFSYGALLSMRTGGDAASGSASASEVVARIVNNVANVLGRDLGAVILPAGYRGASESGQEVFQLSGESGLQSGSMGLGPQVFVLSSLISVFVLIGWMVTTSRRAGAAEVLSVLTIGMVVLVPNRTFRYVLPIAPFIVSYFLAGIEYAASRYRASVALPAFRITAAILAILLTVEHGQYVAQRFFGPQPPWIEDGRDVRSVADWINANLPPQGGVASTNPGLVYLLTGHHTVALVDPMQKWRQWKDSGIRYAVALHVTTRPGPELGYRLLHESPRLALWTLEIAPERP